MKILIVDDAAEKVAEVSSLLHSIGIAALQLDVASSGLEARERLSRAQYDLLLLDIKLPFREGDKPDRRGGLMRATSAGVTIRDSGGVNSLRPLFKQNGRDR
ncbi:MAG: response regulator [Xanthobacteraceae bacterium]